MTRTPGPFLRTALREARREWDRGPAQCRSRPRYRWDFVQRSSNDGRLPPYSRKKELGLFVEFCAGGDPRSTYRVKVDTKAQRKAALKNLNAAFLCAFVPLCP